MIQLINLLGFVFYLFLLFFCYLLNMVDSDGELNKDDVVKLTWIGSRIGIIYKFVANATEIVEEFMTLVFNDCHGVEIDTEKYEYEIDWTATHNVKLAKSGTILDRSKTFIENGLKHHVVAYDVTFVLGLAGGMPGTQLK